MNPHPISFVPIGVIHSEHQDATRTPIQTTYARGCVGQVEVYPSYAEGLRDLEGFSHVILLYHFDRAGTPCMRVKPYLDTAERGVFATRAPNRPNAIGLSVVGLRGRLDNILEVEGLDVLDGTPLLDIKPYAARFDCIVDTRNGWQDALDEAESQQRGRRGYAST